VATLFHPREHQWLEHFSAHVATLIPLGIEIRGLTAVGRATVRVLGLNEEMRQMVRYELWLEWKDCTSLVHEGDESSFARVAI
jgi:hypothetical protein